MQKWLTILFASLILGFWAFYNRFPLVFPDTNAYLGAGFLNYAPADRPVFYGWFLRHVSLSDSLYLVVIAQGFLLSYLLWLWFRYFGKWKVWTVPFLIFVFLLTFFTGASIQVSQLIPDLFAGLAILALGLLLFAKDMPRRHFVIVAFLWMLSMVMHNSHVLFNWLIVLLVMALLLVRRWWSLKGVNLPGWRRMGVLLACLIVAQLAVPTAHWALGERFASSRAGHIFLMNRMVDWGILPVYLEKNCGHKDYEICAYKDAIPKRNFIWDYDNSPIYKTGGWEANEEEYNAILKDIITTPKHFKFILLRAFENSLQQFFSFAIGDTTHPMNSESIVAKVVKQWFPELEPAFIASLQHDGHLDFAVLNLHHRYLMGAALIATLLLLLMPGTDPHFRTLLFFVLIALIANAIVCGTLSGVFDRYQCRVVYLLLLPLFLMSASWKGWDKLTQPTNHE